VLLAGARSLFGAGEVIMDNIGLKRRRGWLCGAWSAKEHHRCLHPAGLRTRRCADKRIPAAAVHSGERAAEVIVVELLLFSCSVMANTAAFFSRPWAVMGASIVFRAVLLIYGRWQDANSPVKYTDIDYLVFTDASRYLATNSSPYERATYRYTPLLAWLLYPTSWGGLWFEFGKVLFAAGDVVTGWLIFRILRGQGMSTERSMRFASIWLLNPMVANISTRGSSEGLVVVIVIALLWAALQKRILLAGCLLGFGVHLKIYPFIYAASIFWWLDRSPKQDVSLLRRLMSYDRVALAVSSFLTFMTLNGVMFLQYVTRTCAL
jgi:phosphatidylinositol glycan class M